MVFLITFLVLCLGEALYIWYQWSKISDMIEMAKIVGKLLPKTKVPKGTPFAQRIMFNVIKNFKNMIWIPVTVLVIINLILASILGGIINFIIWLL